MSQVINTLPNQGAQHIIRTMESVVYGLSRSSNHYDITATHTGARTGRVFTQRHTLNKKEVLKIELRTNHCEVIFHPSLGRAVLFLPYDAIKDIDHYKKVEPKNVCLYRAEQYKSWSYIPASRGEYGTTSA